MGWTRESPGTFSLGEDGEELLGFWVGWMDGRTDTRNLQAEHPPMRPMALVLAWA